MRQLISLLLVMSAGFGLFAVGTDGYRAFTTEAARRLAVEQTPRPLPELLLEDTEGHRFTLSSLHGKRVVLDFFYAGCDTLCTVLSGSMAELQERMGPAREKAILLSITFDPRDDRDRLSYYARRKRANPQLWLLARPVEQEALAPLLAAVGITVLPSPTGGFEHNAALHVVDERGRLIHVADYDDAAGVASYLGLGE